MQIEILTIFPHIFNGFISSSLIKRSIEAGALKISLSDFRKFAEPPHFKVDDTPYGGGAGMVLKPEPIVLAVEDAKTRLPNAKVIALSAAGHKFDQNKAQEISKLSDIILICGRYEGIDQRAIDLVVDYELSIGDYILMGGEVAAMAVIEASVRLIPGVLGNKDSVLEESFSNNLLEAPHYTRPPLFREHKVPDVLLSGDHKEISRWRQHEGQKRTMKIRADLKKESQ